MAGQSGYHRTEPLGKVVVSGTQMIPTESERAADQASIDHGEVVAGAEASVPRPIDP